MQPDAQEPFDATALIGKELDGRYRLDEVLGQGGMGMVFSATQTAVGRKVAVKTLHPGLAMAPTFFERFKREAEVAARLKHPNIVTIFDFGKTADGFCYISMELLDGESLRQQVKRKGPMSLRRSVAVIEQIGLGLAHAHKNNVIHRDMKPHNVMVTTVDGAEYVKVLDFGLVKATEEEGDEHLTSTGQVLGTPQYMPPEQAGGEATDARSDLYSLGAVFHFCLTGSSPYGASSVRKALTAALTQPVPTVASKRKGAAVPQAVEGFLRKALAKEREDRYQTAEEFIADLNASIEGLPAAVLDALPAHGGEAPQKDGSGSEANKELATPNKGGGASRSRSRPLPKPQDEKLVPHDRRVTAPEVPAAKANSRVRKAGMPLGLRVALVVLPGAMVLGALAAWMLKPPTPVVIAAQPVKPPADPSVTGAVRPPKNDAAPKNDPAQLQKDPPPAPTEVTVTLRTNPPGASVLEGDVLVGKTPLERKWTRDATQEVTFQLSGYRDLQRSFRLKADDSFDIDLEPAAKKPAGKTGKGPQKDPNISAFE
jgi:serine/threonine-protein kinase